MPKRIQRRRTKGWHMPLGAIYVGRPSRWGNPFVAHDWQASFRAAVLVGRGDKAGRHEAAVMLYRLRLTGKNKRVVEDTRGALEREVMTVTGHVPSREEIRTHLRGHDLACWCPLDQPCHADVLLEIANT